jgi:hypothetical protein
LTLSFLYVKVPITHARERRRNKPLQHEVVGCACRKMFARTEIRQACLNSGLLAGRHCNRPSLFKDFCTFPHHGAHDKLVPNSILNCLTIMQHSKCNTRIQVKYSNCSASFPCCNQNGPLSEYIPPSLPSTLSCL